MMRLNLQVIAVCAALSAAFLLGLIVGRHPSPTRFEYVQGHPETEYALATDDVVFDRQTGQTCVPHQRKTSLLPQCRDLARAWW